MKEQNQRCEHECPTESNKVSRLYSPTHAVYRKRESGDYSGSRAAQRRLDDKAEKDAVVAVVFTQDLRAACEQGMSELLVADNRKGRTR